MGIGDVLCGTSSSCTVRNPCPSENRAGYGLFFTLRENKTLYKHSRWRSSTSGKLSASITGSSKERKEKRYAERTFSVDNRKERTVAFSRKLYPVRHPERILIRATSGAGLFYGIQTLLQLSQPSETGYSIASVEVQDSPRFAYRGLMLDVSRHFFSKEFVKKQIDALAFYKINRLHLHLTDAAGWRIEIKKYPLLTEFAAWRTDANWKTWWNGGRKYLRFDEPGASGGYYTQDDIREIVEYARQHFITIIPEIEMPAHSEEVLALIRNSLARVSLTRTRTSVSETKKRSPFWKMC